jgi:hypothetical protein
MPTVGGQLECVTLAGWVNQIPLLDVADLYDTLRESLTAAYADYREARCRGWRGLSDAERALAEVTDLVALLDVLCDEIEWRRGQFRAGGRSWPLVAPPW